MACATRCRKKQIFQLWFREILKLEVEKVLMWLDCRLCDQNKADCLVFFGLNLASCPLLKAHSGSALSNVRIPQIKGQRFHREVRMVRSVEGVLTGSPQGEGNFRRLTGGEAESQSWKNKWSTSCLCTSLLFVNFHVFFFSFITSNLSFDSAIGLQMSSGSSVVTVRSDCASSVTKFGEKMHTPLF